MKTKNKLTASSGRMTRLVAFGLGLRHRLGKSFRNLFWNIEDTPNWNFTHSPADQGDSYSPKLLRMNS